MNNNHKIKNKTKYQSSTLQSRSLILVLLFTLLFSSCVKLVEEGIEVNYEDSDATVKVEPIDFESAAVGETISYSIEVNSNFDIKSCIVQAAREGRNGSGFNVSDNNFDDPFADHIFGTVREGIRSFKVRYDYIIPDEINKSRISFSIIDGSGKASTERTVEVVPGIDKHEEIELYAKDRTFNDALATISGEVFGDVKTNYSIFNEGNVAVQEKIDIMFFYDEGSRRAIIAAPSSGQIDLELSVENKTLFKRISNAGNLTVDQISPSMLFQMTADASILEEGSQQISNIKVGDVIGFTTDLNAIHSLKSGLLIITGLHPANVGRYDGVSYVLECEMVVQK